MRGRFSGRNVDIWQDYATGRFTQAQLGEKYGLTQERISAIIREQRPTIPEAELEQRRQRAVADLDAIRASFEELAEKDGVPVTAGKDGAIVIDPETGKPVREWTLRIHALHQLRQTTESERKLLGLDAPARAEVQVTAGESEAAKARAAEAMKRLIGGEGD